MKRLFYVSGTLFFLSLTLLVGVHIGQQAATAQKVKEAEVVTTIGEVGPGMGKRHHWIIATNGDIYDVLSINDGAGIKSSTKIGNVFRP